MEEIYTLCQRYGLSQQPALDAVQVQQSFRMHRCYNVKNTHLRYICYNCHVISFNFGGKGSTVQEEGLGPRLPMQYIQTSQVTLFLSTHPNLKCKSDEGLNTK